MLKINPGPPRARLRWRAGLHRSVFPHLTPHEHGRTPRRAHTLHRVHRKTSGRARDRRPGGRRPQTPTLAMGAPTSASGSPPAGVRPPLRSSDLGATRDYLPNSFLLFVIITPRSPKTASIPTCVTYLYGSGSGSSSHFTLNCIASELITCILLLINENTRCN